MRRVRWSWLVLSIALGCGNEGESAADVAASPIGPAESSDCHQAPWLPAHLPAGVQASSCRQDERTFRFLLGSGEPAASVQASAFLDRHREELHAIDGVVGSGDGICCSEDLRPNPPEDSLCVVFTLRLCSTSLSDFVDKVRAMRAADPALADHSLRIAVTLEGLAGPRCTQTDPGCGPLPYSEDNQSPAPEQRTPVDPVEQESHACSHDGECVQNGCGNACDHWTLGGAFGTCPLLSQYADAYCGCVQERCGWFH